MLLAAVLAKLLFTGVRVPGVVACSCGLPSLLELAVERALQQSGNRAAAVGLSYHKLLLAAAVHPQGAASGSIPWLLLVRAALREKL
jgi:hypothetical protein